MSRRNAFQGAGHPARSLLYELIRQLSGRNNGHLQLTSPWLKKRGWKSADVVQRAKGGSMKLWALIPKRGFATHTRQDCTCNHDRMPMPAENSRRRYEYAASLSIEVEVANG